MTQSQLSSHEPNYFVLQGGGTQITYSTSSIAGKPQFSYHDGGPVSSFSDMQIRAAKTELGTLVTVTLLMEPGAQRTLTLLLPTIRLPDGEIPFETVGIFTTHRASGSSGPPHPVTGALESYRVVPLMGTARSVVF
jgi:hypothetical protein